MTNPHVTRGGRYWCEQAWLGPETAARLDGVLLTVSDGVVDDVVASARPPQDAVPLYGVTLPGCANAHSHVFHRALRGRTQSGNGTFWTWRDEMYRVAERLDPDRFEELATATFAEMVLAGYTVVGEFHYLHHQRGGTPYDDPNEMGGRVLRAARRAGIRLTLLDTCYLAGGIGVPPNERQLRFGDGTAQAWVDRVSMLDVSSESTDGADRARLGAAIHSVRAVDPDSMAVVADWARLGHAVVHAHVSEQSRENTECFAAYGATPLEMLDRHAGLDDRFTAVHATHLTGGDLDRLGRASAMGCVCPTTERDLADGIGPTSELRRRLCIGSDSHAVIDPFEEARAIELDERLRSGRRGTHTPVDLLTAATSAGYRSLGWPGGTIAVGSVADFVTVGLDGPRLAGADRDDVPATVVFAAAAPDVRHVVVAGEHVVNDGHHRDLDVGRLLDDSIRAVWASS